MTGCTEQSPLSVEDAHMGAGPSPAQSYEASLLGSCPKPHFFC
jgi:hypothetical protein